MLGEHMSGEHMFVEWTTPQVGARDHWILEPTFRVRVFRTGAWVVHAFGSSGKVISVAAGTTPEASVKQAACLLHEAARTPNSTQAQALRVVASFIRDLQKHWPSFKGDATYPPHRSDRDPE